MLQHHESPLVTTEPQTNHLWASVNAIAVAVESNRGGRAKQVWGQFRKRNRVTRPPVANGEATQKRGQFRRGDDRCSGFLYQGFPGQKSREIGQGDEMPRFVDRRPLLAIVGEKNAKVRRGIAHRFAQADDVRISGAKQISPARVQGQGNHVNWEPIHQLLNELRQRRLICGQDQFQRAKAMKGLSEAVFVIGLN